MQLKGLDYEYHPVNLRQGEQREKCETARRVSGAQHWSLSAILDHNADSTPSSR